MIADMIYHQSHPNVVVRTRIIPAHLLASALSKSISDYALIVIVLIRIGQIRKFIVVYYYSSQLEATNL